MARRDGVNRYFPLKLGARLGRIPVIDKNVMSETNRSSLIIGSRKMSPLSSRHGAGNACICEYLSYNYVKPFLVRPLAFNLETRL